MIGAPLSKGVGHGGSEDVTNVGARHYLHGSTTHPSTKGELYGQEENVEMVNVLFERERERGRKREGERDVQKFYKKLCTHAV